MAEKSKFNLLDEPWIYVSFVDGKRQMLSLQDCFSRSPEIRRLSFGQDPVSFSVLRIMVAIMQRALYVASAANGGWDASAWQHAYENPKETLGLIRQYLDVWKDRFFLFDPDYPFFQHPKLEKIDGSHFGVRKFLSDVPDNLPLLTMRIGTALEKISYPEAVAQLIHLQAYATSKNLPVAKGDEERGNKNNLVPPIGTGWVGAQGGVYVEGETLFATLMLNTLAIGIPGEESEEAQATGIIATNPGDDLPVWEQEREKQPVGQRDDSYPHGLADMLTWQSRRVRLIDGGNSVIGVVVCQGDTVGTLINKLTKTESAVLNGYIREPMGVWKCVEKGLGQKTYMPLPHDPSRAMWRGITSLLPEFPGKRVTIGNTQVPEMLPPAVVRWVGWLLSNDYLPESTTYCLRSCGYIYRSKIDKATFDEVISDYLVIPPRLLTGKDKKTLDLVKTGMEVLDNLASAVAALAENLQRAIGASAEDASLAARLAREHFYSEIDEEFRAWLLGVGSGKNDLNSLWKSGYGVAKKMEVDLLTAVPGIAMKGRVKDKKARGKDKKTVFDFSNCIHWFDSDVRTAERKMAVSLEGEEKHE